MLLSHDKIYVRSSLEEDGGGEDPTQALPPPQASPGLAQVHGAFLISLHSGASRHGTAMSPGDTPYLAAHPFFVHSFPLFPSAFHRLYLTPFLCLISPLTPPSLPGAPLPSRMGQQTRHRALLCLHSHLTQCGTTWLITNPILGPLCGGRVGSVHLSHFIRAITGHFLFCLQVNVLSDTLNT